MLPLMDTARLEFLDMALVAIYLISVTGLGLWLTRGVKTSKDYFLAGKTLPWWAVGMSLVVSDIGAKDMVGLAADGYRYGLVMMNFDFIGCAFPVLAAAFLFMPFLWIAGVYTVPEYLGRRYNSAVRTFFALLWAGFMMGTVGTILVSAAVMFEALLGWSFWWSVGITAVVVGVFTTMGGLKAVVLTDALSCVVLIVGAAPICILGLEAPAAGRNFRQPSIAWTGRRTTFSSCCRRTIPRSRGRRSCWGWALCSGQPTGLAIKRSSSGRWGPAARTRRCAS